MRHTKQALPWHFFLRTALYTFVLLLVQAQWVSRMPNAALRADLLLPLMFGVAAEWPLLAALFWATLWGYAMDALSGKFWGLHVGSYVAAICLVNMASEKFEVHNPLYQMIFVGVCALGQSLALGMFLWFEPAGSLAMGSVSVGLLVRSLLITILAPFIMYPLWDARKGVR